MKYKITACPCSSHQQPRCAHFRMGTCAEKVPPLTPEQGCTRQYPDGPAYDPFAKPAHPHHHTRDAHPGVQMRGDFYVLTLNAISEPFASSQEALDWALANHGYSIVQEVHCIKS